MERPTNAFFITPPYEFPTGPVEREAKGSAEPKVF